MSLRGVGTMFGGCLGSCVQSWLGVRDAESLLGRHRVLRLSGLVRPVSTE